MKKINQIIKSFLLFYTCLYSSLVWSQTYISVEAAQTFQSKNDQRIPGNSGDLISLTDFAKGPFLTNRIYFGHKWDERHEIRALYAPLELELNSEFKAPVRFMNSTFAANTVTSALYKFNSYRLTYAYYLEPQGDWKWAVGFTGKIRDAEVRLQQGALKESKTNIGFVPLAHVRAMRLFAQDWKFELDFDGLAAPQGRAIDLGLFVSRSWNNDKSKIYFGYRTVEGGADNDEVYNFAWIHSATIGFTYRFDERSQ
ncbi:MAG: hypothetical protein ACK4VO_14070 [Pseudobdellovibrio sp.]